MSRAGRDHGCTRASLACLLLLTAYSGHTLATGPHRFSDVAGSPQPAATDLLGYALASSRRAGNAYAIGGALLGRHVVLFRLLDAPARLAAVQQIESPSSNDDFGAALALDHGVDQALVVAVGANTDDTAAFNAGRVYVYGGAGGVLTLSQQLQSPNPVPAANFGTSLALQADLLVVGEPKAIASGSTTETGAVHVYRPQGGSWQLSRSLYGIQEGARFGQSVALHGDTLVVGSALHDDSGSGQVDTGTGWIYVANDMDWVLQAQVWADDRQSGDRLGISAVIDGHIAVFGAANDDKLAGNEAGSAYVYARTGEQWTQQAKLRSSQAQVQERFGQTLAVNAADGEIVVGAYCLANGGCTGPGAIYVHTHTAGEWSSSQRLAPDSTAAENFGHALAYAGRDRIVVGAFNASLDGPPNRGAVYLLSGADTLLGDGFE